MEFECDIYLIDIYLISKKKEKVLRLTNKLILTFGMVSREGLYFR